MDNVEEREARRQAQQRRSNVYPFRRLKWGGPPKLPSRRDAQLQLENYVLIAMMIAALGTGLTVAGAERASALAQLTAVTPSPVSHLRMCAPRERNTPTKTCVVDGDTLWISGTKYRLESFDTPEPQTGICGGAAEVALAHKASARLLELLNSNVWTMTTGGIDRTGSRTLATIRINGRDVGDILIAERLARHWPDGDEWWCR